jgi:hypothetical protein
LSDHDSVDTIQPVAPAQDAVPPRVLTPAAERALAEAAERRRLASLENTNREQDGRGGLDPVRFGDWEKDGLAIDF